MPARARSSSSAGGLALALCVAGFVAVGCGTAADTPYAGLAAYRPPTNDYVVHYLAPPWQVVSAEGTALRLIIERDGTSAVADSGLIVIPKYQLDVSVAAGSARALVDADVAAVPGLGQRITAGPRMITTDSGDVGYELLTLRTTPSARYDRYVSLDSSRGGAVRLVFEANPDLDEPEVTQMIHQVDVAPEAP